MDCTSAPWPTVCCGIRFGGFSYHSPDSWKDMANGHKPQQRPHPETSGGHGKEDFCFLSPYVALVLASAEGAVHVTDIIVVVSVMVAASRIIF
jgi:hypothetical protein